MPKKHNAHRMAPSKHKSKSETAVNAVLRLALNNGTIRRTKYSDSMLFWQCKGDSYYAGQVAAAVATRYVDHTRPWSATIGRCPRLTSLRDSRLSGTSFGLQ